MESERVNNTYALIMAGGEGTRFVPLSTPEKPKQFLNLINDKSFIRQTFENILPLISSENIYVSTNDKFVGLVRDHLPEIPAENIVAEPLKKNTAPALAYSASIIQKRHGDVIICCLPSDHYIKNKESFRKIIGKAIALADDGYLVTLGMKPTFASMDYGYICPERKCAEWSVVREFTEKPKADLAERYIKEGYLWNGGIFIWKASVFFDEIGRYATSLVPTGLDMLPSSYFESAPSISIDYALIEKSDRVAVIPADIGWSDIGTWESLYRLSRMGEVSILPEVDRAMRQSLGHVAQDAMERLPRRIDKPWGYEEIWAHTDEYVGKILSINQSQRLSYQYHRVKEETLRVLEGIVDLHYECDGSYKNIRLNVGDVFHVHPRTKHRIFAVQDSKLLEISTPYLNDIVRLEDDYGRVE